VALAWNTRSDLDLHVAVPRGPGCKRGAVVNYRNKEACGGQLDVDANLDNTEINDTPVEHVAWRNAAPPGRYQVEVSHYKYRGPWLKNTTTEFRIEVWMDGRLEKTCEGHVVQKERVPVCTFDVTPPGASPP
jgi:hypothetical protein